MRKGLILGAVALGAVVVQAGTAQALVLDYKTEAQAIRAEINKQVSGFTACIVKASLKCEATGASAGLVECDLVDGTAVAPADAKAGFAADLAKCASKVNYMKKAKTLSAAAGYSAIGCPGDATPTTCDHGFCALSGVENNSFSCGLASTCTDPAVDDGDVNFVDLNAYRDTAIVVARSTVANLASINALFLGGACDTDNKCAAGYTSNLSKYAAAVQKCQLACENDYAGKKGNGGPTDEAVCNASANGQRAADTTNLALDACIAKAYAGYQKKDPEGILGVLVGNVAGAINSATNNLYNVASNCAD